MPRPLFQLGERLAACAGFVRQGAVVADIGTDHAYLPIWLLKSGRVPFAYASDVRENPLASARYNAKKYAVEDRLCIILGNGLEGIPTGKVTDIVIAGMGGMLIADILQTAGFVRNSEIRLILQPMKDDPRLRSWLGENRFVIEEERPVCDAGRVYTVIQASYAQDNLPARDKIYPYMGELLQTPESMLYAEKVLRILGKEAAGAKRSGDMEKAIKTAELMREIRIRYGKEELCPE